MREKPRLVLLDDALRIAFIDRIATLTLMQFGYDPNAIPKTLPPPLLAEVRSAIERWGTASNDDIIVEPAPGLIMRISPLSGNDGIRIALFLEEHLRRDHVALAVANYSLSNREAQVLSLMLQGLTGAEIGTELGIAKTTVVDYFKRLINKTNAKNRTEMLARILGWKHGET